MIGCRPWAGSGTSAQDPADCSRRITLLFVAKRDERVDPGRAVRGEQCCQRRYDRKQRGDANEGRRIERLGVVQKCRQEAREQTCGDQSGHDSHDDEAKGLAQHQPEHRLRRRALHDGKERLLPSAGSAVVGRSVRLTVRQVLAREDLGDYELCVEDRDELMRTVPILVLTIFVFFFHKTLGLEPATVALAGASEAFAVKLPNQTIPANGSIAISVPFTVSDRGK